MKDDEAMIKVYVVMDSMFGERLLELVREGAYIWAVESATNTPVAQKIWTAEQKEPEGKGGTSRLTTFTASQLEGPEDTCAGIIESVDEHHNELTQFPAWDQIEVIGVPPSVKLRRVFAELADVVFLAKPEGFVVRRRPPE